jgi:thymidine kinase
VVADTISDVVENGTSSPTGPEFTTLRYQVLCRRHFRLGDLGPGAGQWGQLRLT